MKATATLTKKGSLFAEENILSNPDESLELGVSMSKTEAEIENKERHLYETHVSLVIGREQDSKDYILQQNHKGSSKGSGSKPESEREVAETNKADDETVDDEEVHDEEKVHEDEEMHDVDEIHVDDEETKTAYTKINSMLDVPVQQEIPLIQQAPLLNVLVSVIPTVTTPTPSTTPPTTKSKLPQTAESLSEYELEKILFDKMDKSRSNMTHDKHQELYNALLNSVCLDEAIVSGEVNPDKVLKKRHRDEDQDPPAGSDKEKKKSRKEKDSEPSRDKV
nr:hypothetical protein [Tanacetum cinerariifolium]